ncbi:hypothetical protein [Paucibacter sp. XJ19-41]|uniref:hypothetical protein n=1 Tax=Paucibacter sp. XJ19-41 TaxID=2927824 RepID=UPI002349D80A|nr:hypothetical protein [Paucibacter sp. XJ19-41]MDC6167867.1 hypothetical protein [Paucibacter sp. XJ19-41]
MQSGIGLQKDDDSEIAFVVEALFSGAITIPELREWCSHVIEVSNVSDIPPYIYDLLDYDGGVAGVNRAIGFFPVSGLSSSEISALNGIAYVRGLQPFDNAAKAGVAQKALARNGHVAERFASIFPFLRTNVSP